MPIVLEALVHMFSNVLILFMYDIMYFEVYLVNWDILWFPSLSRHLVVWWNWPAAVVNGPRYVLFLFPTWLFLEFCR